jgi:dipeptidyl aminopeptidase/acylaminoacyl peptidase
LLIHGVEDTLIPIEHARQIAAEAKLQDVPLETYFVSGAGHCGAYGCDPFSYNRIIQSFLIRHLGEDFPEQHRNIS